MRRQLAAARFVALLVLATSQVQGRSLLGEESCDGCLLLNTSQSFETNGDPQGEYLVRTHDTAGSASKSFFIRSNTSFTDLELKPQNEYEITILGRSGELYSMKISGLQIGPGEIRNLRLISISDTKAELHWDPPLHQSGAIVQYSVSLKRNKLLGCEDLGRPTPPQNDLVQNATSTTALFADLHPYADYTATVIAHTSVPGSPQTITFQTSQSSIPTSTISNLRLDELQYRLKWDKPVDCTSISGATLGVRLFFTGFSDLVQNWTSRQSVTYYNYFSLNKLQLAPYEWYRVRVHVIRSYTQPENVNNYRELTWRTLPVAPPAVRLLEIYDMDFDQNAVSLRWLPPVPANGEIKSYHVLIRTENKPPKSWSIDSSNEGLKCKQWENYLCLGNLMLPSNDTANQHQVEVYAMNKGVAAPGALKTIMFTPDSLYNKEPSTPLNLTAIIQEDGKVTLKWAHPLLTYTKLARYRMRFDVLDANPNEDQTPQFPVSVEYRVDLENSEYSAGIQLPSSTNYRISIAAVNRQNLSSTDAQVEISVPSSSVKINAH